MKKSLIIGFLILSFSVFGQIPGKNFDGPIVIFDTLTIKKGDIIYLGKGSDPDTGNFLYIATPENFMTHTLVKGLLMNPKFYTNQEMPSTMKHKDFKKIPQGISNYYNGKSFVIDHFSKISSKKNGEYFLGVINTNNLNMILYSQTVDFEAAIKSGEIIKINEIDFINSQKSATNKKYPVIMSTIVKREMQQFNYTKDGVLPINIVFKDKSKNEIYEKTLDWHRDYYNDITSSIATIENEEIRIESAKTDFAIPFVFGKEMKLPFPYLFRIGFIGNEIRMSFIFYSPSGELVNNGSPMMFRIYDKKGKANETLKNSIEKLMNETATSLVNYLDNN